ncbi:hypothetical protein [Nostoc sp.]|uniref:hypothetical protein n=1 Tax=Nostoc sp. TaxID=1180 RepID=UPI002FFB1D1C
MKSAIRRNGFASQKALAENVGLVLATISNLLTDRPVERATFEELCQKLALNWKEIADLNFDNADKNLSRNTLKRIEDWGEAIESQFSTGVKKNSPN